MCSAENSDSNMFSTLVVLSSIHLMDLSCQAGCENKPSPAVAEAICRANSVIEPNQRGVRTEYFCKVNEYSPDVLADYMCLCTGNQNTDSGSGSCSSGPGKCGGYGCCYAGEVCISSHILNSNANRCFNRNTGVESMTISNAAAPVKQE